MEGPQAAMPEDVTAVPPHSHGEFERLVQGVVEEHKRHTKFLKSEIVRLQQLHRNPDSFAQLTTSEARDINERDGSQEAADRKTKEYDFGQSRIPGDVPLSGGAPLFERQDSDAGIGSLDLCHSRLPSEPRISERVAGALTSVHAPSRFIDRLLDAVDWLAGAEEPRRSGICYQLITSKTFHQLIMLVVLVNSWFIVRMSDVEMQNSLKRTEISPGRSSRFNDAHFVEIGFACFYAIEWTLRLYVHRMYFFVNKNRWWNIMDTVLVLLACYELRTLFGYSSQDLNITYMRLFRFLKVMRGLRLMREFRFVREMRLLFTCVLNSASQLLLCTVLVLYVLCMFSVIFVQVLADYVALGETKPGSNIDGHIRKFFGSVPQTMVSLYMATTGGIDWEEQYAVFHEVGWAATALYLFFISFFAVVVWNIVMSTFVEKALQLALPDIESLMADKHFRDARDAREICDMIRSTVDENGDGVIHLSEFENHVHSPEFQHFLQVKGFDCKSASSFFDMLKSMSDQEDAVDIETFVACCLRLQGGATSIDLQTLRFEMKRMYYKQKDRIANLEDALAELIKHVAPIVQPGAPGVSPSRRSPNHVVQSQPDSLYTRRERAGGDDVLCDDVKTGLNSVRL